MFWGTGPRIKILKQIGAVYLKVRSEGRQTPRLTEKKSDDVKCEPEKQESRGARVQQVERVLSWQLEPEVLVGLLRPWTGCFVSQSLNFLTWKMRMATPWVMMLVTGRT